MSKNIPFQFDCVVLSSGEKIHNTSEKIRRLKVGVFTKYSNRNGSYITDAFAEKLIESAPSCPVVGFFDHETKDWAGHLGPSLVSAYGYVEHFVGWAPFIDSDGIEREYAVFSIVAFSDYFEEAQHIVGKHQSMEIDPETIIGEWGLVGENEYFIYTEGKMKGFCILGDNVEPCFSASAFFNKQDDKQTQFEKFSSLLIDLKAQVEEGEKITKGGEQPMNEFEEQVVEQQEEVSSNIEDVSEQTEFENVEENTEELPALETESEPEVLLTATVVEQENLELDFTASESEENNEEVETLRETIAEYEQQLQSIREELSNCSKQLEAITAANAEMEARLNEANATISHYQAIEQAAEEEKKNNLIKDYENVIPAEELEEISSNVSSFSYNELESKLALSYARKNLEKKATKVFVPQVEQNGFAALMEKYKKN